MGLDIRYYDEVTLLPEDDLTDNEHWDAGHIQAHVLDGHERSAAGLELGRWYAPADHSDGFRAGSYGGYNQWRAKLARLAGYEPEEAWADPELYQEWPFFLLVNFADNEGTIGPEAAADLALDFDTLAGMVAQEWEDDPHDRRTYEQFRTAFRAAAYTGAVVFT